MSYRLSAKEASLIILEYFKINVGNYDMAIEDIELSSNLDEWIIKVGYYEVNSELKSTNYINKKDLKRFYKIFGVDITSGKVIDRSN